MAREIAFVRKTGIVVAGLVLGVFSPALADWQYTKWGMTPEEVVAASGGMARPDPHRNKHRTDSTESLLAAPYAAAGFEFDATFQFSRSSQRLERVHLDLIDTSRCSDLIGALRSRYGEPESESKLPVLVMITWRSDDMPDQVALVAIESVASGGFSNCQIQYHEKLRADSGL